MGMSYILFASNFLHGVDYPEPFPDITVDVIGYLIPASSLWVLVKWSWSVFLISIERLPFFDTSGCSDRPIVADPNHGYINNALLSVILNSISHKSYTGIHETNLTARTKSFFN